VPILSRTSGLRVADAAPALMVRPEIWGEFQGLTGSAHKVVDMDIPRLFKETFA
jgi:hypothetical protein